MFSGSLVALITPFRAGAIDESALERLIEFQLANGTDGLVPCGTTGESPALTPAEHEAVVALTVRVAREYAARTGSTPVPVLAGAGSNSTAEAIHYSQAAERDGADGLLHVTPYYNKPTQEGLYQHFRVIAASTRLPIVLYNVPGRTSVNLLPETVARLAEIPNIVGIKEASGNIDQASQIRQLAGPDFTILSGDDSLTLPIMAVGGTGVISVVANIAPRQVATMVAHYRAGRHPDALRLHETLFPLSRAMFIETNPGPVKTAAELLGLCGGDLRLPLVTVSEASRRTIAEALAAAGVSAAAPV